LKDTILGQKKEKFLPLGGLKLKDSVMVPKLQYKKGSLIQLPNKTTNMVQLSSNECESRSKLVEEAKENIADMLHKEHYSMAGMLTYLAKEAPEIYVQVAGNNRLDLVKAVPTIVTLSMASYLGLNDTQLELLRSWLQNECDLNLEYLATELKGMIMRLACQQRMNPHAILMNIMGTTKIRKPVGTGILNWELRYVSRWTFTYLTYFAKQKEGN
jgi:hypothetical protein